MANSGESTLTKIEGGERNLTISMAKRLAPHLNCTIADLQPEELVTALTNQTQNRDNLPTNNHLGAPGLTPITSRVEIVDYVQAGKWRETIGLPDDDRYFVPMFDERYTADQLFGVEVRGDSMNLEYPPGRILICRKFDPMIELPPVGKDVIIRRRSAEGLIETTVKALEVDDHGKGWLAPKSTNPEWQKEEFRHNGDGDHDDIDTEIIGVVIWDMRNRA